MLMKVRIRENIYLPTEFTTDWCESPITKKELCSRYNLNLEACDFYNDRGELVRGPELDGDQVTVLQRPMGVTGAIIMGAVAVVAAGGSIAYSIYQKNRAEERAKNQKKLSNIYSYSLRGSTNDQRQYSPIPVVLGKVNVAGDKAGLQYSTYASNHQDVHQLICVGYSGKEYHRVDEDTVELVNVSADTEIANYTIPVGGVVFEKASEYVKQDTNPQGYVVRIADSPVDTFDNMYVDTQTGSDNNPTYYTERAIEISQMSELQGNPDSDSRYSAIIQTSPKNTIKIRVGVYAPYGYYKINDNAEKISTSYNYTVQYRKVGTSEWTTIANPNGSMNQSAYRNLIESSTLSADQYQVRVFRNDYGTYYEWDSEAQQFKLRDSTTCITLSAEIIQFVTRAEGLEGERGTRPIPYPGKYSLLSVKARANDRTNGWLEKVFTEVHLRCRTYGGPIPSYPGESLPACTPSMWVFPTTSDTLRSVISNNTSWHCLLDGGNLIGTISPLTLPYVLKDGSVYRTVYSATFESDGKYIVLPLVYEQALHTREQAWQHYLNSNEYMGKFDTLEESETFAVAWHEFDEWKIDRFYNKTTDTWCTDELSYLEVAGMNNPASVLLYILTCPQVNPRPVSYKDIDWESLRRWWLFCNDRGWTVNAFVTEVMSVAELAQLVCAAGRAHLVMSNNKFSVAIEDQTSVITQIFTPRNAWNMVQSKSLEEPTTLLKCAFVNDETEVEENRYIHFQLDANGNIDRTGGHVTIVFDDAEEVLLEESNYKSETADFWGVTNANQIGQLGAYQLYKGLCLNTKYTWECGLESLSCTVGDVVYLANDVFASSLGYGRIKGVKKNGNQQIIGVYIDESIEIHSGQTYGLTIRTGAGEVASKALFAVQNNGDDPQLEEDIVLAIDEANSTRNYLQFESPLPANSDVTSGNLFIYNDSQQLGKKVIIESIQPNNDRGATITAVDYIPEMYTIDIDSEIPVYKSTINKYGTGANIAGGYTRWDQPNEAEIKGERGSEWTQGNVLTGKTYARGVPGKEGDYYLNTDTYYIYRCITSGSSSTAYWQYVGDIKGEAGTTITEIKYGVSSSDSTEPSSWSSSVPTVNKGDWLWVRVTYSNSNVQYTKSYIGTDGDDGNSIYIQSATKVGKKTTIVIVDDEGHTNTLEIDDGVDGATGQPGLNGYVHIAWANSADGSVDFSTSVSRGKSYIGTYTDNTQADSQVYTSYSWTKIKGENGANGYNTAQVRLLKRATSRPAEYNGGVVTYTFATGAVSFDNDSSDGWSASIPSGNGDIYAIYAPAYAQEATTTIQPDAWSPPEMLIEDVEAISYTAVYQHGLSDSQETPPSSSSFSSVVANTWQKGKYVWTREVRTYDNTGETVIGTPYYNEELTKEFLMTCRFDAIPSSFTWNKNLRHAENVSITVDFTVIGYGTATPQITAPSGVSVLYGTNSATVSFNSLISDEINLTVNLSTYPLEPAIVIKLSAVDITERGIHFPVSSTKITSTTYVESGVEYRYVEGDYYLWRTTKTEDGVTYNDTLNPQYFNGTQWVDLIGIANKNTEQLNALLQLIPDVFQYANGENMLSLGDYSFFKNIIAQNISAEMLYSIYIRVGQAIYGGTFEADGTNPTGGQGFYLSRDGLLNAVNAILTNATITGTITHDALATVDAQYAGHLAGVTSGNYINTNDLYNKLVSLNISEGLHDYPVATNAIDNNSFNAIIVKSSSSNFLQNVSRNTAASVTRDTAVTNAIVSEISDSFVAPFSLRLRFASLARSKASYKYNTVSYNGTYTYSGTRWESSTSGESGWSSSVPTSQSRPANPSVGTKYYTYTQTNSRTYYYWDWVKENTTGSWEELTSGHGYSNTRPTSDSKPRNPRSGDTYTVVSNVGYVGDNEWEYDYTTYIYETETYYTYGSGSGTSVPSDTSTTTYTVTDSDDEYKYTTTTWEYKNYSETHNDGVVVSADQTGEAEGYLEYRLNSGSWQRFNNDTVVSMAYRDSIQFRQTIAAITDKYIYTKTGDTTVSSVAAKWQEILVSGSAVLYYDLSEYNVGFNFINKSGSTLSVVYELSSANALYLAVSDCHVELTTGTDLITQLQKYSTFTGFTLGGSSTNGFFYRSFTTGSTFKVAWETRGGTLVNLTSANGVFLQFVNGTLNVIKDNAQFASLAVNDYVKTLEINADPISIDAHVATKTLTPMSGMDTLGTEDDPYHAVFADNVGSSINPSSNVYTDHLFFGTTEFTAITTATINNLPV